jgi:hypothetical protein
MKRAGSAGWALGVTERREIKQVLDFLTEVHDLEPAALSLKSGMGLHQFAESLAVDVLDVAQVQQKFVVSLF